MTWSTGPLNGIVDGKDITRSRDAVPGWLCHGKDSAGGAALVTGKLHRDSSKSQTGRSRFCSLKKGKEERVPGGVA